MHAEKPHMIVEGELEGVVVEANRAIEKEGLQVIARVDDVWRSMGRYVLFEAWSPELWREAFMHGLAPDALMLTTFRIYEIDDGGTAVEVTEPFSQTPELPRAGSPLEAVAQQERARAARVLERLRHPRPTSVPNRG